MWKPSEKIECYLNPQTDSKFTDYRKHKNYVISYGPLKFSVNYILYRFKHCGLYSL
jgi:hypothetical protein